ncbi:MAG: hypothetical protein HY843_02850 [Bdellovibrio sp.]|nr:hypothetical protein [Bdellovibrio sp.]
MIVSLFVGPYALAEVDYFDYLHKKSANLNLENKTNGWAYMISGALVLGGSIPGYYLSKEIFSKVIYTAGQNFGIAGIGYGAYLAFIDNDYKRFENILQKTPELTREQKNKLAYYFFKDRAEQAKRIRMIRVVSHGLSAGLNILNGLTSDSKELGLALFFLGGVNVLASIGLLFSQSAEEKMLTSSFSATPKFAALNITYHF